MGRAPLMELSAAWLFCEVVLAVEDSRGNGARLPLPNSRSTARGVTVRTRPPPHGDGTRVRSARVPP